MKKVIFTMLLVLMVVSCINTCSAEDSFNETLGTDTIDEVDVYDVPGGDNFIVEANGCEDYDAISSAVSAATGGGTVFVKNGEYALSAGEVLEKTVPERTGDGESVVLPEGTIYLSDSGNDENDGLSEENAIATFSHAVDMVKARENKTATVYVLNGDYTTGAIDIGDDEGVSLSIVGQEKDGVIIHGTGAYVFDIYGDNLVWNFKNLVFDGLDSTARTSAALVLYSKDGNFTIDNCNFRNINSKLGAIAIGNENGNTNVTNCIIEDVTGSTSNTVILTVNDDGKLILDNIEIKNCKLDESVAVSTTASYLRTILYVNTYGADITLSNSKIIDNNGPMMSLIESRSKLTIVNTTISDNVVNASLNGANGGDNLIWANNDNSNINITQCIITGNTIVKSGKGLFYNQRGSINVEYSDLSKNSVDKFIGSTGTITANNNWWATNDQPDANVDKWVIMNVEVDDSELSEKNEITLTIDFNHVKTSSGNIEVLAGGEIHKDYYVVEVSAQNGEITPASIVVNKSQVKSQTFTVTNVNDVITVTCDGDNVEIGIEGEDPSSYDGIVYVNKTGDDNNEGTIDAPVASLAKAIEIASAGSGRIFIDEGTYIGYGYQVTNDLNITGVGKVTLDADGQGGLFATGYPSGASKIILNNLILAGADANYGQAINSYASELILNNVSITDNPGSGSLIIQSGKLTMNDCVIANHNGATVIDFSGNGDLIINNTLFENNTVTNNAIVYSSSYDSRSAIVENTAFINNTGQLGIFKVNKRTTIKDSKFINNTNKLGYGGAISDSDSLTVTNTTFINNKANKDAGAISVGYNRVATITKSTFINNTANLEQGDNHGDAIYNKGRLTLNYCVLLTNAENSLVYSESENDVNAQYNWWGTNEDPSSLNGVGTYEDDWGDDADCVIDSSNWVYMNVTTDMVDDTVLVGDSVEITVDFTNYIDSDNALKPLSERIPEVDVSASAIYGDLDSSLKTTSGNVAEFVYGAAVSAEDIVNITSSDATALIPINVDVSPEEGIIYVSPNGDDSNDGLTKKNAVKTIAHAMEIATKGQIVLLNGVHTTGDLGSVYEDLNITGQGKAVIDANNNNRILYVGSEASVVIKNVIMINGYTADESGALLGNSNRLTLINCTLANSSAGTNNGGAIFNVGKLTIINTTIANCSAKQGGAIFSQCDSDITSLEVINSTFENNIATGYDMNGGGAIYTQRNSAFYEFTLNVDNSTFINNRAEGTSSGGAIALVQLDATAKISNSKFIANHANGKEGYGGGAIYVSSASNYYKYGTMTITGSLFENNTCGANGGAIYGRVTTITVSSSVLIDNADANGLAVYGYKTDSASPSITLNDNWWGSNDSPKDLTGGNNRYKPTLNRWAILTANNDSAIQDGNTIRLTASINNYTTGTVNGTMSKPITVKRDVTIKTTAGNINGTLENGEFAYDYEVPENIRYVAINVDDETVELLVISSKVKVEVNNITARKYDMVNVVINVTAESEVNSGVVELYADDTLLDTIPVSQGKAIKDVVIPTDIGIYDLIAKFVDESGLFDGNESHATLNVTGICELWNSTFFNFFDDTGVLRNAIGEEELVFHGEFSGIDVNVISIPKSISISGDNAKIYDIAFKLLADDIKVSNISFVADKASFAENSGALILVSANAVELNNIAVNYTTPKAVDAFAVLVTSDEFNLINSTIIFDSNNDDGSIVNQHALQIRDSNDFLVSGNVINATLPARDVAYTYYYSERVGIDQDLVLAIGIQNGDNGKLTQNEINVLTKSAVGDFPTIDSIMVDGVNNLEISYNNITHLDTVNAGNAGYSNAIDLYNFDGITVMNNNVLINSTAGIEAKGTAYPVQATGPYNGLLIDNNNLTSVSNGPALGIYSQNYEGGTDIVVTNNCINVTGLATPDVYALVSGIELQDTYAKIYNNTIYTDSVGAYSDKNALYGISYAQDIGSTHMFDIRDNTVYTDGKYAVYLLEAVNSNVTDNTLYAHELLADDAVHIAGDNNVVKDNKPLFNVIINASANNTKVDVNATVEVILSQSDAAGNVSITIDGTEYIAPVVGGSATIVLPLLPAGNYTFDVVYSGDDRYGSNTTAVSFAVDKYAVEFNKVKGHSGRVDQNATVDVILSESDAAGTVYITVDGTDYSAELVDGAAVIYAPLLPAGSYNFDVIYSGDDRYESNTAAVSFAVDKYAVEFNKAKGHPGRVDKNATVDVILSESDATGTVSINVNGIEYSAELVDGAAVIYAPLLPAGTYNFDVIYSGDAKYENNTAPITFNVNKYYPTMKATAADVHVDENAVVNVVLPSDATGTVTITVDGVDYTDDVVDGSATVELPVISQAGAQSFTVSYSGDDKYRALSTTVKFNTLKVDATIKATAPSVKVGNDVTVNVVLPKDATGEASISVNGNVYTGIVKNGAATIVIPDLVVGEYSADVIYAGDEKYNDAVASVSFAVEKNAVEFTKAKGHPGRVDKNATVDVVLSESDATGTVYITVDGVDYSAELVNGKAVIYAPLLPAGTYNFDVIYSGDAKYENNTAPITFNVNKYYPTMKATAADVHVDESAVVNVVLPSDATGTVTITVDGVDYTGDVVDGTATVELPIMSEAGEHTFEIVYSGDDKYRPYTTEVTFSVIKNSVDMKATARTVRVGDEVTVNVVLSSDATGSVSIVYGDNLYSAEIEDGTASIVIPDLPIGQYALTVEYSGDDTYKAKNTIVTFNVNKQNSALKATARTVHVGDDVIVNVALSSDATGNVTINVDDVEYTAEVTGGAARITIPDLTVGKYALKVQYSGDDKYKARNTTVTFNVNKASTRMKATARTVKVEDNVTVNVALASDATGEVIITVNGADYTAAVEDGVASIVIPELPAGQYALDVKYGGDDKYKNQSTYVKFNVNKHNVRMKVTANYNYKDDFAMISTILSDDATGTIAVEINSNEYAAEIVDGSALIAVPKLPTGDYTLDIRYSGDDKYKNYTVTKTLKVDK
ncbi:hypothetical protein TL18_09810 [Methanobrevibacter sp. YE315]|uniref:Ig-like domain repeat protein n=1 Tax=Methanobrevibacter sp. YE315 TaxID=1609968 RepID=UPI000764D13D|nr:Ig-like domain repeat protein [Methanobrevibacter sp. YE315]AMD18282.1 hypothetical protein TL18_09810 [Methanobrevibacter sp. YE315]